jgi:hypothetical protein
VTARVYCGPFESENHWREPDLARLPALPDAGSSQVVQAMDELLFVFCGPDDRLLTVRRMNDAHVEYLNSIGFRFQQNTFDLYPSFDSHVQNPLNLFTLLAERGHDEQLSGFLSGSDEIEPFAVVPGLRELVERYGLKSTFPPHNVIQRVNTKTYSLEMRDALGIPNVGIVVDSIDTLLEQGTRMLADGPFLVKDDYGVSGKGNQIITQQSTLQRIASYLAKQVSREKRVQFVLEPYLAKRMDFSCQFHVGKDGSFHLISVQQLTNNGLAFGMSSSPSAELVAKLQEEQYFALMEKIAQKLFADGYFGHVCVDSMWLNDGSLSPLVEINARRSMSLIKHEMDRFLADQDRTGSLTSIGVAHDGQLDFAGLLNVLQETGLLFEVSKTFGILPLSCGTLFSAGPFAPQTNIRGRFYIEVVCETGQQRSELISELTDVMERTGFRVSH